MYGSEQYPKLALIATRITGVCASASISERNWSSYDFQMSKSRLSMSEPVLDNIMSIYFNTPLLQQEAKTITMQNVVDVFNKTQTEELAKMEEWAEERNRRMMTFEGEKLREFGDELETDGFSLIEQEDEDVSVFSPTHSTAGSKRLCLLDEDTTGIETD
ncbi:hypothetical protein RCL1_008943 [Eukaryota sp. TZLM3-RCL]